ncbi:MAG: TrmH family RNA methyltransferase [Lachnospiraceae bacterium]|nr:TrmH family RNA methyltransferase [Lachnospiraceae bacterium]
MEIKSYKKDVEYSYTLGAFPTIELLKTRPEEVLEVYVHSTFTDTMTVEELAKPYGIPVMVRDKQINKLSDKENCFVIGVLKKYQDVLRADQSHVVLVNPSNMGNMGTIIRTAIGFGIKNLAIISPGVDVFNPKTIRASMGALFRINCQYFSSFEEYEGAYPDHEIFCFMLNAKRQLTVDNCPKPKLFSLVFGNEATGLDDSYLNKGTSIIIPQSEEVDSLNITIAAGVGMYLFTQK